MRSWFTSMWNGWRSPPENGAHYGHDHARHRACPARTSCKRSALVRDCRIVLRAAPAPWIPSFPPQDASCCAVAWRLQQAGWPPLPWRSCLLPLAPHRFVCVFLLPPAICRILHGLKQASTACARPASRWTTPRPCTGVTSVLPAPMPSVLPICSMLRQGAPRLPRSCWAHAGVMAPCACCRMWTGRLWAAACGKPARCCWVTATFVPCNWRCWRRAGRAATPAPCSTANSAVPIRACSRCRSSSGQSAATNCASKLPPRQSDTSGCKAPGGAAISRCCPRWREAPGCRTCRAASCSWKTSGNSPTASNACCRRCIWQAFSGSSRPSCSAPSG